MNSLPLFIRNLAFTCCLVFLLIPVYAQKMSIGYIYPSGGKQGTSVEIEIGGLNIREATGVVISGDGIKGEIIPLIRNKNQQKAGNASRIKPIDQSSPQLAEKTGVRISISPKAIPGLRDLRLRSPKGVSNKLNFEVGQYPDVLEKPGSSAANPVVVNQLPASLCGQILPGEVDYYVFKAEKGLKLVVEVKARALVPFIADAVPGWFQPVILLKNSRGIEIAYNDEYRNSPDPVILTTIPETGDYTLSIHDAIYRGREDFTYRISLGEIPFLERVSPCSGRVGGKTVLFVSGVNIASGKLNYKPLKEGYNELRVTGNNGCLSNPVAFWGIAKTGQVLISPPEKTMPDQESVIYSSISSPRAVMTFEIDAVKNENIAVEVLARRLGSLLDAKLTLRDPAGRKLAEADDVEDATRGLMTHHADPVLQYKATRSGPYLIDVSDVTGNSGPDCFFLLKRIEKIPEFQTFVSPAILTVPRGGTALFRVDISSRNKVAPGLNFEINGLPAGFIVSSLQCQPGSKSWEISVTAPETAKEELLTPGVLVHPLNRGKEVSAFSQVAIPADNMMQAFYYNHLIPASGFVVEITKPSAFSLRLSSGMEKNIQEAVPVSSNDSVVPVKIRIFRSADFKDTIDLELSRKTPLITLDPTKVLPGESEKTVFLKINREAIQKVRQTRIGIAIVGTVNAKVDRVGKRSFQNALYREYSPLFVLQKRSVL